jgi:AcrR family transcriptional regulator
MSPDKRPAESTEALRTSLVEHAQVLIAREGPSALTMRALAAEAGCATGFPYKVFADRHDLVVAIIHAEFGRLRVASEEFVGRAGTGTVASNLAWFAERLLDSPAVALSQEVSADEALSKAVTVKVHDTGIGPGAFELGFAAYLAAEKKAGRIDHAVDADAFAFLIAGAVHNLIMSGEAWPRPTRRKLKRRLAAVAAAIAPRP